MPRRTKEEALATRSLILDTAELLFEARGVSNTSLGEIAKAAGLTRGAIYWHFDDKADLFHAMMERVILPLEATDRFFGMRAADLTLAQLRDAFVEILRRLTTDPQLTRVFDIATHKIEYVDEMIAVRARRLAMRADCLGDIERGLRGAGARGELAAGIKPRPAALGLVALFDGLVQNWLLDREAFDMPRVGAAAFDAYLRGLAVATSLRPACPRRSPPAA